MRNRSGNENKRTFRRILGCRKFLLATFGRDTTTGENREEITESRRVSSIILPSFASNYTAAKHTHVHVPRTCE